MTVQDVVAHVGLWWPAADEDGVYEAAAAWERAAAVLDEAASVGTIGADQAREHWTGDAADRFEQAWHEHEQVLRADAAACTAIAGALRRYADAVTDARRQVEEIAVVAGATIIVGVGLAWATGGITAAVAADVAANLVAAAAAVGLELSAMAAAIVSTTVVGAVFGAAESLVVDMAVTQPLRVWAFDDGGFSSKEAEHSIVDGGVFGGVLGGMSGVAAVRPMARIADGELGGVRAPGGAIRAALDPTNWGPLSGRFRVGVHPATGVKFRPHEQWTAQTLAAEGGSVHLRPPMPRSVAKSPDVLIRRGADDPGTYTELKGPTAATSVAVQRCITKAEKQLRPWGGGEVVVDGRVVGLSHDVAQEGLDRTIGSAASSGQRLPESVRIILSDGTSIRYLAPRG